MTAVLRTYENVAYRIEVEDSPEMAVLLVFDRKADIFPLPYPDATELASNMEGVIRQVEKEFSPIWDIPATLREQAQVKLAKHDDLVVLFVDHTDRLRFTQLMAFGMVMNAMQKIAQDCYLEEKKGILLQYNRLGMIKTLHNKKLGYT